MAVDMNKLVSLDEAQQIVIGMVQPLPTELVSLEDGGGRVLAQEIRALTDQPSATQAAMDGYAVRSADLESASPEGDLFLKVVGSIGPGQRSEHSLKGGETLRVMTGSILPVGADAIVSSSVAPGGAGGLSLPCWGRNSPGTATHL